MKELADLIFQLAASDGDGGKPASKGGFEKTLKKSCSISTHKPVCVFKGGISL